MGQETIQWIKHLLCKSEDQNSDTITHVMLVLPSSLPVSPVLRDQSEITVGSWLAIIAKEVSLEFK